MQDSEQELVHARRVAENQRERALDQELNYDFIICGAGSAGSVVAGRLSEDPNARILLLEAGRDGRVPEVLDPAQWPLNLNSERDWAFQGEPSSHLNGRGLPLSMGKMLGGGSGINVMVWARGHKADWDHFAEEAGDLAWGYDAVLGIYRRIEDWQGRPDPARRGTGGLVHVEQPASPQPVAHALIEAARAAGIPDFESPNGQMMEGAGGVAIADLRIRGGRRQSVAHSYLEPRMAQPNLTVLTQALVTRLLIEGCSVVGVEAIVDGRLQQFRAGREVILSMGAVQTPKLLMQSGIGPEDELRAHGIDLVEHLPGVGRNHQDHVAFGCTWAYREPQGVGGSGCEATLYWKSDSRLDAPDMLHCQLEFSVPAPDEVGMSVPEHGWTMFAGLAQPKSRGRLHLSGARPSDRMRIEPNALSEPEDIRAALATVELCRDLGNSAAFQPLVQGEAIPRQRDRGAMENYLRNAAVTFWHQCGTAKMGRDDMAVVDHQLRVRGIDNLRIADASIMPRITTGNTMAPCVVIGERAAEMIAARHGLLMSF